MKKLNKKRTEKNLTLKLRGKSNQKIIDIKKYLK